MYKRLNEDVLPQVNKKIKKVPVVPKKLWELGLTKKRLLKLLENVPDDTPIITPGFDHSYDHLSAKISTALFDNNKEIINEDFGEDATPESKYGKRKEVIILV